MKKIIMSGIVLASVGFIGGCACLMKMGVNSMAPTFKRFSATARTQNDPEVARLAFPSNLLMLDGMLGISPKNVDILSVAAEANCGYAMLFVEDKDPEEATKIYVKGRDYALRALKAKNGKFRKALDRGEKVSDAAHYIRKKDIAQAFWAGNCWANWLNLNKRDPRALFDIPAIKALMQRVMELDETYFYGSTHLFFGTYYAGLPAMAGGGADKSEAEFAKALDISKGKLLLIPLFHAQYYATLIKDENLFVKDLKSVIDAPSDLLPDQALVNEVARKKAQRLLKDKDKYF